MQHGAKDDTPGANAIFELLNAGGFLVPPLRTIEGDQQRQVKCDRPQRIDQKDAGCSSRSQFSQLGVSVPISAITGAFTSKAGTASHLTGMLSASSTRSGHIRRLL
ncbi:hypothetical protein [Bradyrhizobium sp. ARR65]|uniref:hypothetical protein n=1 Tax=Bradyrhizobium sp. ARR65 TaxID=1040989 RepID=UPI0012FA457A|nr:hypothetical protein [Bradyrhizobium sp. ARR65]